MASDLARGGSPVPVEPDPNTFNLDPDRIAAAITTRNRAHDWRGQTYRWSPSLPSGHRTAFDAERLDSPVPEALRPPE